MSNEILKYTANQIFSIRVAREIDGQNGFNLDLDNPSGGEAE